MKRLRPSLLLLPIALGATLALASPRPPARPAEISIAVAPEAVVPGGETTVTIDLAPIKGVKINRYPRVKLVVPGQDGLIHEGQASVGDTSPPEPERIGKNYFETFEPVELKLTLDGEAPRGRHEIDAKLTYFYCMPASGFCAPARVPVKIPVNVR